MRMKKLVFLIVILFYGTIVVQAQTDTITIQDKWYGTSFKKDGKPLPLKKLELLLKNDAIASEQFKKGKGANTVGVVLGSAGGFLVGYTIGEALGGGPAINPAVIALGAGLIGLSIPFTNSSCKKFKAAVETYNGN